MSTTASEETKDSSVSVMLLRLQHKEVLIPKAMVADVLSWKQDQFSEVKAHSHWRLGEYAWQDWQIPLICFESLIEPGFQREVMQKPKIVVIKSFQKGFEDEHYALLCRGFPKPLILSEESLENLHIDDQQDWIEYSISIGSRILDVPDFVSLQSSIWSMADAVSA